MTAKPLAHIYYGWMVIGICGSRNGIRLNPFRDRLPRSHRWCKRCKRKAV